MSPIGRPVERGLVSRVFVLAWAAHFFHATATNCYVHLPGFLKALGATELLIGTLSGATAAIAIASRPLLAPVTDRVGRRAFITSVGGLHVALCTAYCFVSKLGAPLYALRIVHGVVEAVLFSTFFAYAAEVVPPSRRTEGLAWFGVSGQIPIALASIGGDRLLGSGSYRELFVVTIALASLGFAVSLPLDDGQMDVASVPSRGVIACALQRDLLPLWFVGVAFATSIAPVFIFLKTYVLRTHVGSVGLFLSLYSLSAASLRLFFGWVPDRIGPKRALGPAILAVALGMWLIAHAASAAEMGFAGVLAGAGHGLAFPIVVGLVVDRAATAERGVAMSLVTSIFDVGQLMGGPAFGALIDAFGYGVAFAAAGTVALVGLVVFSVWDARVTRDGASATP